MNLDFHVHGLLSRKSKFNEEFFLLGIENAKEHGLNGFILCDHFNAENIQDMYKYLEDNYEYLGDRYCVNGFYIFLGTEVNIKSGGHVIVSGNRDAIYDIQEILKNYKIRPNFIQLKELIDLAESYHCLIIGCHPYRGNGKLCLQDTEDLKRLDALDLNAKDIFKKGKCEVEEKVNFLSKELGLPVITGSDSHFPVQLGAVKTIFEKDFCTIKELKEEIRLKNYSIYVSSALDLMVFSAKTAKRYIKKLGNNAVVD